MAKLIYWVVTGGLWAALGHGLDLRGMLAAGLVCWSLAGVCVAAVGFIVWGRVYDAVA